MTRREIDRALPFWQQVLRLEDWHISVRTARAAEMWQDDGDGEGTADHDGLNYINPEELKSDILLRRGATEEHLVHELLHLVFDGDRPLRPYDVLHERGINRVAGALLSLKNPS